MSKEKEIDDPAEQRIRIEEKLDGLINRFDRFSEDTRLRFKSNEDRQQKLEEQQQSVGRWNWQSFGAIAGVIVAGVVMVGTASIAFINVRVAPLESGVAAGISERQSIRGDIQRIEDNGHREQSNIEERFQHEQAEMDERLQREMRLVSDVISKQGDANKDAIQAVSKRVDDATYRIDKIREEGSDELMRLRLLDAAKVLGK